MVGSSDGSKELVFRLRIEGARHLLPLFTTIQGFSDFILAITMHHHLQSLLEAFMILTVLLQPSSLILGGSSLDL